ncbi:IS3 family transposase [Streptomyces roseochromogenus]|uniref:IS3 family transposase n=1 Tax=Streptomyces roseochromogenus TaxID=285450 RepID=UPI003CC91F00
MNQRAWRSSSRTRRPCSASRTRAQSWLHKWINRAPTAREQCQERLDEESKRLSAASDSTYGSPQITRELHEAGWIASKDTGAALMTGPGLCGRRPKRRWSLPRTGRRDPAGDLVHLHLRRCRTRRVVVRGIHVDRHRRGPLHLATVEDLVPCRVLGHAMSAHGPRLLPGGDRAVYGASQGALDNGAAEGARPRSSSPTGTTCPPVPRNASRS